MCLMIKHFSKYTFETELHNIETVPLVEICSTLCVLSRIHFNCGIHFLYMMMMSSVQPFSALVDPMNKGSPLMSTLHQLSQFSQSVSCFCKDALHPSHPLSASPPSTTNLPQHYINKYIYMYHDT